MSQVLLISGLSLFTSAILAFIYEMVALIGKKVPTISAIVQKWVNQNASDRISLYIIGPIWIVGSIVLLIHFLTP